ncbi:MAG: Ig-like domain-containing protein, partial [Pelobacteraceae bacterium]
MKTIIRAVIAAAFLLTTAVFSMADGTGQTVLTSFDFNIVGVGLKASPEYQAVPKGIASKVNASFEAAGFNLADVIAQLPEDYTVRAELSGPAFQTPVPLVTKPGIGFDLPTLALTGRYTLSNIRLVDGNGATLFGAVPQVVAIESIPDPLITSVTTRQLTVQELQDRGVTFDNSNFTAYEFTAGIATSSGLVPLTLPVIIPRNDIAINPETFPQPDAGGLAPPGFFNTPPQPDLPDGFVITGFMMDMGGDVEGAGIGGGLPSIPGVIVIPGNIGFLHQYFSALAIITNGAPKQSDLIIKDVKVKIILPLGEDLEPGTDAAPNDDPLRMAKGENGFFPREMTALNPGPDGKSGTLDDISSLKPSESGQADFTIEGLKEGTHKLDFEITATLEGLPIGPVTLKGKATGAVLVRNPDFAITMGHPATVRSGEAYDLFITVSNTGKSVANLISVHLDQRALSGVVFASGELPDKQIATILPGSAATVKFRLVSQRTGKVTATVFESPDMKGRFILRAGVGENGIPLSPDSLILPYVGDFPSDLVNSAVGLLGQAWSVATAPAGALPADVLPITKQTVTNRAYDLSEAGLRVLIGDTMLKAVEDLAFDFIGSNNANRGFDDLRRRSTQGRNFNTALAAIFATDVQASDVFTFQAGFAEKVSFRPAHISVITSDAPVRVRISDSAQNKSGGLAPGEALRCIPYADQLLVSESGSSRSTLSLVTKLDSPNYLLELSAEAAATFDLGIVLPDADGVLQQVKFSGVTLPAGAKASMALNQVGNGTYTLAIDGNGDGIVDANLAASSVFAITDKGPQVVAATQIGPGVGPGGDIHGRNVALLFSKQVTKDSAQNIANFSVEGNAVKASVLQTSGRMAFIFLRDGIGPFFERSITVSALSDAKGIVQATPVTLPIKATAKGPAAVVAGVVRTAKGEPIPGAVVHLVQWPTSIVGEKISDANGGFQFDYVSQGEKGNSFMIEAINPTTGEVGHLSSTVLFHGQRLNVDIFMKARGSVSGTVRDVAGTPVANAAVQMATLNDNRTYLTYTDASGVFSFVGISVGPFNLKSVSQTAYAEGTVMGTLPDDGSGIIQDMVIYHLADVKKGNVAGKVLGPDGVTPRPGVVVVVSAPSYTNWVRSGADGSYAFSGVFVGAATVSAQDLTSGEQSMATGTVSEGITSVYNLILKGTGSVVGQVQRGDGKSASGLYVVASDSGITRIAQADAAGNFRLDGLPVGEVSVEVFESKAPNVFTRLSPSPSRVSLFTSGETANISLYIPAEMLSLGTIQGTIYRVDGSVAPLAQVRLSVSGSTKIVQADNVGKYLINDLPMGMYSLVMINGNEIANASVDLWHNGQVSTNDLHPAGVGTITGTIYDVGSGMMPVGADVTLISTKPDRNGWLTYDPFNPKTVKSDPQTGRYTFAGVYMGNFSVSASNNFRPVPTVISGVLKGISQPLAVDLTLIDTFGSISGTVLQPDGTPAGAGVRVTVRFGGADVTVTTDATGKFVFRPIIPAGMYMLKAEDTVTTLKWQGYASVAAGLDVPLNIKLLGRGSVTVLVTNADGTAAPGAKVDVVGSGYPNDSASGMSGQDGSITFDNLSEGSYSVSVMGSFNLGGRGEGKIPADHANVTISVMLASSGKVVGKFFKADGVTPISGGEIKLLKSGRVLAYTTTSSDSATLGTFSLEFVPLGDFSLEGYDPVSMRKGIGGGRVTTDGESVTSNLVVVPRGTVKGVVLNYSGSAPIDKAAVTIVVTGSTPISYRGVTTPDGSYLFSGVPAGRFTIDATDPANGLRGQASGTISYEGETAQAEVRIAPTGSITGRVLMPDGVTPALNATVALQSENIHTAVDPLTGEFTFSNLASGRSYTLVATEANTHRGGKAIATISGDGAVVVADVILRGVGTVWGTVFDTDGETPLVGAMVTLQGGDSAPASYTVYTGPDGSFRFIDVPVGTFNLRVPSHPPQRTTAAATSGYLHNEGEVVTVNMTIGPVASLAGKVLLADGVTPARGGAVRFTGSGGTLIAIVDTDGLFAIQNIPIPCTFSLDIEDAGGIGTGKYSGNLADNGEHLDIGTIVLDDKPITIIGVNPSDGLVNVTVLQAVKVLFSEAADPATITSANVYITQGNNRVAAALLLDNDNKGVTLTPSAALNGFTSYTIVVTTGVKDRVGRALPQNFTATFTTIDNIPPSVKSVSPANGTVEVASDGVVRVTFSETIDPAYVSGIKLLQGNTPVAAQIDVIQGGTVAVLTPLNPLAANGIFNVSVSDTHDMVGNIQLGSFISSFNTIDTIAPTISSLTIPATSDLIKGNTVVVTAVSPDTDVAFVDFYVDGILTVTDSAAPFTMNLLLAREGLVQVKAVAQDRAGNRWLPVSLDLTVVADQPPTAAFTAPAEGNSVNTGSVVNVGVTAGDDLMVKEIVLTASGETSFTQTHVNTSGKSFASTFSFTAPTAITQGGNVVLTAVARDSAGNSSQAVLRSLTLHDGTAPVAVSLVSDGQAVKYRPGDTAIATFVATDNIEITRITCVTTGAVTDSQTFVQTLPQTNVSQAYSFTIPVTAAPYATVAITCTGFDAAGNQASKSITLTVADATLPQVTTTSIANNATDVPIGSSFSLFFSETVASSSITTDSVVLTDAVGQSVPGTVTLAADRKGTTFKPAGNLIRGAAYTLTVTTAVSDDAGNPLLAPFIAAFTTDNTSPTLKTITPANGAQNVPIGSAIAFTFSEAIDPHSVHPDSILLTSVFGPVAGTISLSSDNLSVIFKPMGQLSFSRDYTVNFKGSVADSSGNVTAVDYTGAFLTQSPSSDLVGLWTMDGDWSDSSGNSNHGTANGSVAFSSDHAGGTMAGNFDGSNDYIKVTNSSTLNPANITVEAWVKSATPVWSSGSIVSKASVHALRPVEGSKEIRFYAVVGGSQQYVSVNDPDLDLTQWHHYAATADGYGIKLYIDGVMRNSVVYFGNLTTTGTGSLSIGYDDWQTGRYFKGLIDEVSIYKQALLAEDILEHFQAALASDRLCPAKPTVNQVVSPTYSNNIILSGTKDENASIRVNGKQLVGHDLSTTWQALYSLQPGQNILDITSRGLAGDASDPVTIPVELLPANQRDTDIAGLWHLDGNWQDYSGNGNHGTPNNGAAFTAERIEGAAAGSFDGVNDYASIADSAGLDVTTAMTLEAWIKPNDVSSSRQIISKYGASGNYSYQIGLAATGQIRCDISGNGSTVDSLVSTNAPITLNAWQHVAATFNAGALKLYVNGVEVASKTSTITALKAGTTPLNIGRDPAGQYFFNGLIDEVAVYKRALTMEEIQSHLSAAPVVSLASPGQTTKYRPGEAGTATVTVNHAPGVNSLTCTASGAASGMMIVPFGSSQTAVSQDFTFDVTTNAASYATVTLTCRAVDAAGRIGSAGIDLIVADIVVPTVAGASIADNATNVAATKSITVSFFEALAPSTVNASSVALMTDNGTNQPVSGTVTLSPDLKSITFQPATALEGNTPYRLIVSTAVTDTAGNPLVSDYVIHFTTQAVTAVSVIGKGSAISPFVVAAGRYSTIAITGSYVVFDGPVAADSLSLTVGSVLTQLQTGLVGAELLEITATDLTIDATSKMDVTGKGYLGSWQGGNGGFARTIGNTTSGTSNDYFNGGSYGGLGGISNGTVNAAYG